MISILGFAYWESNSALQIILEKSSDEFLERHGHLMDKLEGIVGDCKQATTLAELEQINKDALFIMHDEVNAESNLFGILRFNSDRISDPNLQREVNTEFNRFFTIEDELWKCLKEKESDIQKQRIENAETETGIGYLNP